VEQCGVEKKLSLGGGRSQLAKVAGLLTQTQSSHSTSSCISELVTVVPIKAHSLPPKVLIVALLNSTAFPEVVAFLRKKLLQIVPQN